MRFVFLLLLFSQTAPALTFKEAIERIENHEKVSALNHQSDAFKESARSQASWGDPMLKVAAKNFPVDSFKDDQTPMTGIEVSLAQKIPLSSKRSHLENSALKMGESKKWESIYTKKSLHRLLWKHIISLKKFREHKAIIDENVQWITKIIAVSKNLYANGKVSQQAILDLQIRKSELRSQLVETKYSIESILGELGYLTGDTSSSIDLQTIPWKILAFEKSNESPDPREQSLTLALDAKDAMLNAKNSAFIPDLTVGVGYTKRSNIDGNGDFVTIMAQVPIPVSERRGAEYEQVSFDRKATEQRLLDYRKKKKSALSSLEIRDKRFSSEIYILKTESINFAKNARKITAKAYELGTATYVALLQSELKLQKLLLKDSSLTAMKRLNSLEYKFILGENLHE